MPPTRTILAPALVLHATSAAAPPPAPTAGVLAAIAADVDPNALHDTVAALVGFGTRHTA